MERIPDLERRLAEVEAGFVSAQAIRLELCGALARARTPAEMNVAFGIAAERLLAEVEPNVTELRRHFEQAKTNEAPGLKDLPLTNIVAGALVFLALGCPTILG